MTHPDLAHVLSTFSTPHLADACLRVGAPVRCAPAGLVGLARTMRCAGRVVPSRHYGSVDVFFEALEQAGPGDVLVVDNGGRTDEACVGDLVTLEVKMAGLFGMVIWGLNRDTDELLEIGFPVFSMGTMPTGPQRLDPRSPDSLEWARVGPWILTCADYVASDADGVVFLPEAKIPDIITVAKTIRETERRHADRMRAGTSFREQTRFKQYLQSRASDPTLGFREHLRRLNAAIEE